MNYETFKWCPLVDATQEIEPLVDIIQFGDGVEQRQKRGLRDHRHLFSDLTFVGKEAEIKEISTFLLQHVTTPFYFNIGGDQFLVRKDGAHKLIYKGAGNSELSVNFVEVVR